MCWLLKLTYLDKIQTTSPSTSTYISSFVEGDKMYFPVKLPEAGRIAYFQF